MVSFGSGNPRMPWRRWERRQVATTLLCTASIGALCILGVIGMVYGGCSAVPEAPLEARWATVCALVGRPPGCVLRPRKVGAVTLQLTEQTFTVTVAGDMIGTWPIVEPVPIDPARLSAEMIDRLVKYQTGGPETQAEMRRRWRLSASEVAYLDDAVRLDGAGTGLATLEATVAVVRK